MKFDKCWTIYILLIRLIAFLNLALTASLTNKIKKNYETISMIQNLFEIIQVFSKLMIPRSLNEFFWIVRNFDAFQCRINVIVEKNKKIDVSNVSMTNKRGTTTNRWKCSTKVQHFCLLSSSSTKVFFQDKHILQTLFIVKV